MNTHHSKAHTDNVTTVASQYQQLVISVQNIVPGQNFDLELAPKGGQAIEFSAGQVSSRASGISMNSQTVGSPIPLTTMSITPAQMNMLTASGGGGGTAVAFQVTLYLFASLGLEAFTLCSTSVRSGASVQVSLGGGAMQPVGDVPTPFFWNP
jgi:hypothetical protein